MTASSNAWRGNAPSVLPRSVGSGVVGARVGLDEGFGVGGDVVGASVGIGVKVGAGVGGSGIGSRPMSQSP